MIKINLRGIACAVLCCAAVGGFARPADATLSGSRLVTSIMLDGAQYAKFTLDGAAITGRPGCHQAWFPTEYSFDYTTNQGKAIMSLLTSAFLSGKKVSIQGSNACLTSSPNLNIIEGTVAVWFSP